ncbi:MAG: hypothetical protein IT424_14300 [Pirellulales bacterium]|nr:hypothetical protein [Pirellulales bacterium]
MGAYAEIRTHPGDSHSASDGAAAHKDKTEFVPNKSIDVRVAVNTADLQAPKTTQAARLLLYALPNGNTIEQTLGCRMTPGLDWHYDIQHVAAQTRLLRQLNPDEPLVLLCAEAGGLSWPNWRASHGDANARIGQLLQDWRTRYAGDGARVTLAAHSGGGSFLFGVIEAFDDIPAYVDRIAFLDANYSFDAQQHAAKLARWLQADGARRLVVLAYDDRQIELDGKRVVGPQGGTFRATGRMVDAFKADFQFAQSQNGPFTQYVALDGRVHFCVHTNPDNKILHTALVGEMNGLVHAQTLGTPAEGKWGRFGGPPAYEKWIQAKPMATSKSEPSAGSPHASSGPLPVARRDREGGGPSNDSQSAVTSTHAANPSPSPSLRGSGIPARPAVASGGRAFMQRLAQLPREDREAAILKEISRGNIPSFLRQFKPVPIASGRLAGQIEVMPDYLAVGGDDDFVRIPMTPQTAQEIAARFGCTLPTRKMVDAVDAAAEVKLAPQPLAEDRESIAAFLLSNEKIEQQRAGRPLGALTIGAKKDIVLSPRIFERPNRVCIYGWRQLDGRPIQPLSNVHVNSYVDYSHGVRLVCDEMTVGGEPRKISEMLKDDQRCSLVSDEGPVIPPRYPTAD